MSDSSSTCHDASLSAGEPLIGSATEAVVWVALEFAGPWAPKILESEGLMDSVREHLAAWENTGARIQFIRRSRQVEAEMARSSTIPPTEYAKERASTMAPPGEFDPNADTAAGISIPEGASQETEDLGDDVAVSDTAEMEGISSSTMPMGKPLDPDDLGGLRRRDLPVMDNLAEDATLHDITEGPFRLLIARTDANAPLLLEFSLTDYEQLLALDLQQILSDGAHPDATVREGEVFLVCTHGKRDQCCAKHGTAIYRAMAQILPDDVFQTSHLGGHRFAATMMTFPHGVQYGRLTPPEVPHLIEAHNVGEIYDLGRMRGRSCLSVPAQVAEHYMRIEVGAYELGNLRNVEVEEQTLDRSDPENDGVRRFLVRFERPLSGLRHELWVEQVLSGEMRPTSCGSEPTPVARFKIRRHASTQI